MEDDNRLLVDISNAVANVQSLDDEDILARFGGDELVLYLPRTSQNEAQKISGRIEKVCRREQVNYI